MEDAMDLCESEEESSAADFITTSRLQLNSSPLTRQKKERAAVVVKSEKKPTPAAVAVQQNFQGGPNHMGGGKGGGKVEAGRDDEPIIIRVYDHDGSEIFNVKMRRTQTLGRLLTTYSAKVGVNVNTVRLFSDGGRVLRDSTPLSLGLNDGDQIHAILEQLGDIGILGSNSKGEKKKGGADEGGRDDEFITVLVAQVGNEFKICYKIKRTTQLGKLFAAYSKRIGLDVDSLRFLLDGWPLFPNETPLSAKIEDGEHIDAILEQVGDIGIYDSNSNSRGAAFLNAPFSSPPTVLRLSDDVTGDFNPSATFSTGLDVLDTLSCQRLIEAVDAARASSGSLTRDFKMNLDRDTLVQMVGAGTVKQLERLYPGSVTKIKVRRCGCHGQWIPFHTDHHDLTLQVPLNGDSDYTGGKLIYVTGDGVFAPSRPAGSYTIHDNKILHGVSRLDAGVRYGLFFLGRSNTTHSTQQ
jgi:small ubiquitin-related modifier